MYDIDWNEDKNNKLKQDRGIGFEDVVLAMSEKRILADIPHYNQKKYKKQKILILEINNYAYVVPYVIEGEKMFLKTIYPSRTATKLYLN